MASFKDPHRDPEAEAARLKRQFHSVSRRIEWRYRLRAVMWWVTVCAIAMLGAFAGTAILLFAGL